MAARTTDDEGEEDEDEDDDEDDQGGAERPAVLTRCTRFAGAQLRVGVQESDFFDHADVRGPQAQPSFDPGRAHAVTVDGTRGIPGIWAGGGEGAKYWLHVPT